MYAIEVFPDFENDFTLKSSGLEPGCYPSKGKGYIASSEKSALSHFLKGRISHGLMDPSISVNYVWEKCLEAKKKGIYPLKIQVRDMGPVIKPRDEQLMFAF
jgi:hypothetical protein